MELINTHCHTKYCGHGEGEVAQYVDEAAQAGLTLLAFTEHFPLSKAFDPDEYLSVTPAKMPAYETALESEIARAAKIYPQLEIISGLEMDYLGQDEDRNLSNVDFSKYKFILGSVHFVDKWAFDDPAERDAWLQTGAADRIWRRYIDLWCSVAADKTLPYDCMAHPDLAKKFGYYPTFDLAPEYARMAEAAREGERMVEVNTSGAYYDCKDTFPTLDLLREFNHAGVPCTVGTDAHKPQNVARDIRAAYAKMAEAGYKKVTVPTKTGDRREIEIQLD
jgi:histidinol-phosphatase (PHP family)